MGLTRNFPHPWAYAEVRSCSGEGDPWAVQPLGNLQCSSGPQGFQGCSCQNRPCSCDPRKPISMPGWAWVDLSPWTLSALCVWDELKAVQSGTSPPPLLNGSRWVMVVCGQSVLQYCTESRVGCEVVCPVPCGFSMGYTQDKETYSWLHGNPCHPSALDTASPLDFLSLGREDVTVREV